MLEIFKKELNFYFKGMFGYFFGAVLLMFAGIYTLMVNCNMGYANFDYTINNMSFMYLILIPVLTMRSFAEERKQRTDQLLYSLPLTMTEVVLGKYLALLATLLIPTLIVCAYPLALMNYGAVSLTTAWLNALAFFLLGAALIAVGMFISSVTENQAIAAGLSFAAFLISYFGADLSKYVPGSAFASLLALIAVIFVIALILYIFIRNFYVSGVVFCIGLCVLEGLYMYRKKMFEGLFTALVRNISVFERFYVFARGSFDLKSILFFLSMAAVFLFMAVQSLEKRRWS